MVGVQQDLETSKRGFEENRLGTTAELCIGNNLAIKYTFIVTGVTIQCISISWDNVITFEKASSLAPQEWTSQIAG